jgi:hypothetical protein
MSLANTSTDATLGVLENLAFETTNYSLRVLIVK